MRIVEVWTDGASKGNPGNASFGTLCKVDGKLAFEESHEIGIKTNNAAEYAGLVYALSKLIAMKLDEEDVTVRMDSELVVKQINGEYKLRKKELAEYYLVAKNLIARFRHIRVVHVMREDNASADRLSNLAFE